MAGIMRTLWWVLGLRLKSRARIEAENLALRHQLNVVRRSAPKRVRLRSSHRLLFIWLYRLWPGVLDSVVIIQPETVVRWHRRGFKAFWRWKSRGYPGRPSIPREVRDLIREISLANPLWGRATDPRRAFEAGDRGGSDDGREVHVPRPSPTFTILEDVPPKPRRGHCFDRFLRCTNGDVQTAIRAAHHTP